MLENLHFCKQKKIQVQLNTNIKILITKFLFLSVFFINKQSLQERKNKKSIKIQAQELMSNKNYIQWKKLQFTEFQKKIIQIDKHNRILVLDIIHLINLNLTIFQCLLALVKGSRERENSWQLVLGNIILKYQNKDP